MSCFTCQKVHLGAKVHPNPDLAIRKWEKDTEMKKTEKKRQNNSETERLNSVIQLFAKSTRLRF